MYLISLKKYKCLYQVHAFAMMMYLNFKDFYSQYEKTLNNTVN